MKTSYWWAAVLPVLFACGGAADDDDPGDGRPDAGMPDPDDDPDPGDPGSTCDPLVPSDCAGDTICLAESCEPAFGRTYRVSVFNLETSTQNPEGSAWDAGGGAPDPYVGVYLNGELILVTAPVQDTFTPEFPEFVDVVIPAGARLEFSAWDEDISEHDGIIGCVLDPLTADYLRIYGPVCQGDASTGTAGTVLDIAIVPKG